MQSKKMYAKECIAGYSTWKTWKYLEMVRIYFPPGKAPGKLNFGENTPGNTWKNIFLL